MEYMDLVEQRVYEQVISKDIAYGVIIGTVPTIFLGAFGTVYAIAELVAYAYTKNKMWLYASIASFIVSFVMMFVYYSDPYRNFIQKTTTLIPVKFSQP